MANVIRVAAAAAALAMACSVTWAEVKLASVFTDHMVVQRDKPVVVWGTATAGKTVTVKFSDETASTKADASGNWTIRMAGHPAADTAQPLSATEEGANTVSLQDVLVGDVWVCSGQSNMEFALPRASNAADAVPAATDDKLRLLVVPRSVSDDPQPQQKGTWAVCSPDTAAKFSAVGYFFGRELRQNQHVPVGLVGTYWGGTLAEAWTPKSHLADAEWQPLFDRDRDQLAAYPSAKEAYDKQVKAWESKPTAARGRKPAEPRGPLSQHRPGVLWNGMVQPLVPMTITGVIWYQGESNAGRAEQYRTLFPNLITAWRDEFRQPDLPFLFVQLANYGAKMDSPAGSPWAELRDAQAQTLTKLPNTGMAVTIDVGNPTNSHPTDKQTVGHRLALAAEHIAYGKELDYQGPTYKSMAVDGDKLRLTFDHAAGLTAKGGRVKGLTVAGDDHKFLPADAAIDGNTLVVTLPSGLSKPAAVRYAWSEAPDANLYNAAGLPTAPFRTDDWPLATAGKK